MKSKYAWIAAVCICLVFACGIAQAKQQKKSSQKTITKVQGWLHTLGYYNGKINGKLDKNTVNATKAFQKNHHLVTDGIPGKITRKALISAIQKLKHTHPVAKKAKQKK